MKEHQRSHLFASYLTISKLADDLRLAAREGQSPSGVGGSLSPLPDAVWEKLWAHLQAICELARRAVEQHAPEVLAEHAKPQPPGVTRAWAAVLLGRLEEVVDDLQPARMERKLGAGEPSIADALAELGDQAKSELAGAWQAFGQDPRR